IAHSITSRMFLQEYLLYSEEGRYWKPGVHNTTLGGVGGVSGRNPHVQSSFPSHQQTWLTLFQEGMKSDPQLLSDGVGGSLGGSSLSSRVWIASASSSGSIWLGSVR